MRRATLFWHDDHNLVSTGTILKALLAPGRSSCAVPDSPRLPGGANLCSDPDSRGDRPYDKLQMEIAANHRIVLENFL
jgi:hypothetical protein